MGDATRARVDACALEGVVEATSDAVVFVDGESRIVRFNRAASQVFGYNAEEVLGEPVTVLMPPSIAKHHASYIERFERSEERRAVGVIRNVMGRRKSGELFPVELSVTPIEHDQVRYAAFLRDISTREQIVSGLSRTERLAAIGLRAAMFAHEVGNPLNNMYIQAQLLERRVAKHGLEDELGEAPKMFLHELRRLVELLQQFRSLGSAAAKPQVPVSVVVILVEVLEVLSAAKADGVELNPIFAPGLPPVDADPDKLKQVFLNLCKNALEAMPEGGRLTLRAELRGRELVVEFEDTGEGIAEDIDPFEVFHTTKPEGSGLGLAVVRQIVGAHRGFVGYRSQPGQGTVFTVRLPIRD